MVVLQEEEEFLVEETEPTDDDEAQEMRYEILTFPTDFTVQVMYEKWRSGQLIIPPYQRRYVWNVPQASRLIESFLLGLPIPQVFLYREQSGPELHVVDGHQRLATIAHFYGGEFADGREFRLRGVNSTWNGKTYETLSDDDRVTLDDATLRSIVIRQIQPNDNSSVYQIFERLNTGGTQLNPMEIRRAIFRGQSNALLDRLNKNEDWRALIGRPDPDPRLRDVEMLLRVLALAEDWEQYRKPMKMFITSYMGELDKADANRVERTEDRFSDACATIRDALGDKPFHLRNRLNLAALDAVMACVIELGQVETANIQAAYDKLQSDPEFMETVTYNTSDTAVVLQRFAQARASIGE